MIPALWTAAILLFLLGLFGTIFPGIPGPPLVFLGFLIAAWIDDFEKVSILTIVILALLTTISVVIDYAASSIGAKRLGASPLGITGAFLGTFVGLFFGVAGIILGPFVGAFLGEYITHRKLKKAGAVGIATWLGIVIGTAVKLAIVFATIGIFALAWFL